MLAGSLLLTGCKKETETFEPGDHAAYLPLELGRYIVYQTDSTVFTEFGRNTEVHSYEEKHLVDSAIEDNLGRPGFRVFRYLRAPGSTDPWKPSGSYFVIPTKRTVEIIENNMRLVKLSIPLETGFNWKGNQFLFNEPFQDFYTFSNDDFMYDWDYTYTAVGETLSFNGEVVPDVITVHHVDESVNVPIDVPSAYASINYATEQYARGIGMVSQELTMWEYQPNPGGSSPYKTGFGIKRTMIAHN